MADEIKIPIEYIEQVSRRRDPALIDRAEQGRIRIDGSMWYFAPEVWKRILRGEDLAPTKMRQALNVLGAASHAARSVVKTSIGIDRATNEQVESRLAICRQCPGDHAVFRSGELHTCGPMIASMREAGEGTCGCILEKKARDLAEDCPFGWWPIVQREATGST